ncbi:hypothetical protein M569_06027 [Genlisea aurea]|uniref:Uncharacterized protein n=1 Tax=Genlisea aurea TaxID=192259 RepID=S8CV21_9LAMI|nr:hypothetical protein M569_06027 [Genlisea aurea]
MAKSIRSKREKRLRAIRRELVEPIYEKKEAAKLAVLEAAMAAPKLPVRTPKSSDTDDLTDRQAMDVEEPSSSGPSSGALKPVGKKLKKKIKIGKRKKHHGKGKIRKKHI